IRRGCIVTRLCPNGVSNSSYSITNLAVFRTDSGFADTLIKLCTTIYHERKVNVDTITKAAKLMEKNQTDEAIALLEDYSSVADDEEKFMIVELYHQWGYIQKAIDLLQALEKKYPMESDIKIMLADMLIEIERDEAAIELLDQVKEDDEAYVQALVQLADLYQAQGL